MHQAERHSLAGTKPSGKKDHPKNAMQWSQVGETLSLLALAIAQIEHSMSEGGQSVAQLTDSFTELANQNQIIIDEAKKLRQPQADIHSIQQNMAAAAEGLTAKIQQAVIAFQFYDRLSQRLDHTSHDLENIGHLIAHPQGRYQPDAWQALQSEIKGRYTMETERIMFDHIMHGHSIAEALKLGKEALKDSLTLTATEEDDIELF